MAFKKTNYSHMKPLNSSSLANFNSKKLGIVIAFIFLIIELAIQIKGVGDENFIVKITHLGFLVGLVLIAFNYEKVDDERFLVIRYFSFRNTMIILMIVSIGIERKIAPIYMAIGTLMCYLIIYYLCVFFNPEMIYTEKKTDITRSWGRILSAIFAIIIATYLLCKVIAI